MIFRSPNLPANKDSVVGYLRTLSMALDRSFTAAMGKDESHEKLLLVSPSKKIFSVTVDDSGVLTTTLVQE